MSYQPVLFAFTQPISVRQAYFGLTSVPYDPAHHVRIMYRNYPTCTLYPKPFLYHPMDDYYCPESVESESIGSSIGFDLKKPEEYRITGKLFLKKYNNKLIRQLKAADVKIIESFWFKVLKRKSKIKHSN